MLLIQCPWCGPRSELEFHCGGEAGIVRAQHPEALSDEQWADYLFMRSNNKGAHHEQWCHQAGCGRWFNTIRDTVSYRFVEATKAIPQPDAESEP